MILAKLIRVVAALVLGAASLGAVAQALSPQEARAIAKDAYIYGFPLVDNYRIQYSYFVDRANPEFKAPWNALNNVARVYTPDDKAIQTPNSDTPYSQLGADLRAEPLVISVPKVAKDRYYSLQFIDQYTYNFAYVGSRATGSDAARFLLAGPGWNGAVPPGIKAVIRSETQFAFVLYRTQLFGPKDIDGVKAVQAGYKVQTLSQFLGKPAPAAAAIDFIKPLDAEQQRTSLEFFNELNFILQFTPPHPSERALLARFARAGIGAGKTFDPMKLDPPIRAAMQQGIADAWDAFATFKEVELDSGKRPSSDGFGTRAFLKNDYMVRMSAAALGIYGNSKAEAIYPAYFVDADRQKLTGSNRYTLRFAPGQLPPVHSFWSLTMYELPSSLLYANSLNRYLINSAMMPSLKKDADGGLTLYLQHDSPGPERESNWLPTPAGPFWTTLRLYWPKTTALNATWKQPPLLRAGPPAATAQPPVPDLSSPDRWKRTADGAIIVTPDNFIRAESDTYMAGQVKDGAFGKFHHTREPAPVDRQLIVRLNRDTIYSAAVFDLDAGPVTVTLPDAGKRFVSMLLINEDHYNPAVFYGGGTHTLTRKDIGTRYVMVGVRTLADPKSPDDMKAAHAVQDGIIASQPGGPGTFEVPRWDPVSQKKVRDALIALSNTIPDLRYAAGPTQASVDPVRRIAAAASGWGLNPDKDAIYLNVFPDKNDGRTPYRLTVKDVPVDAFWSVSAYTADGFYKPNDLQAYSINSVTGKRGADGSMTILFGNCTRETPNCLPVSAGWNYMVRLYRPRREILDGSWSFPVAEPIP